MFNFQHLYTKVALVKFFLLKIVVLRKNCRPIYAKYELFGKQFRLSIFESFSDLSDYEIYDIIDIVLSFQAVRGKIKNCIKFHTQKTKSEIIDIFETIYTFLIFLR